MRELIWGVGVGLGCWPAAWLVRGTSWRQIEGGHGERHEKAWKVEGNRGVVQGEEWLRERICRAEEAQRIVGRVWGVVIALAAAMVVAVVPGVVFEIGVGTAVGIGDVSALSALLYL
jgi:hypothetical protein